MYGSHRDKITFRLKGRRRETGLSRKLINDFAAVGEQNGLDLIISEGFYHAGRNLLFGVIQDRVSLRIRLAYLARVAPSVEKASALSRDGRLIACTIRSGCFFFGDFGITKLNKWSKPLVPVNFALGV